MPYSRPLLLVTNGLPEGQSRDFIEFMLSPAGQGIVAEDFIPLL